MTLDKMLVPIDKSQPIVCKLNPWKQIYNYSKPAYLNETKPPLKECKPSANEYK